MKIKKILAISLSAVMAISLAACNFGGGKTSKEPSAVDEVVSRTQSGEGFYKKLEQVSIDGIDSFEGLFKGADGKLYLYGKEYYWGDEFLGEDDILYDIMPKEGEEILDDSEEAVVSEDVLEDAEAEDMEEEVVEGDSEDIGEDEYVDDSKLYVRVASIDANGDNPSKTLEFEFNSESCINAITVDKDGNFYLLETNWAEEENNAIHKYDKDGKLIADTLIKKIASEYISCNSLVIDEADNLCCGGNQALYFFDLNLTSKGGIALSDDTYVEGIFVDSEGKIAVLTEGTESGTPTYNSVDIDAKTLAPVNVIDQSCYSTGYSVGYDFTLQRDGSLYGYSKQTNDFTVIFDGILSNVDPNEISMAYITDDSHAIVFLYDEEYNTKAYLYEKQDPAILADKEVITLGCYYLDAEISKKVIEFNESSDTSRITIINYARYNTADDYTKGMTTLKNDIAANKCPDIIILDESYFGEINKFAKKGAFTDLGKLLDEDADLSRDSFLPNIVEICTVNDEIVFLPTSFWVASWGMKESIYNKLGGDVSIANIDALEDLVSARAIPSSTKRDILYNGIYYDFDNFASIETGKCNFDSDEFKALLNYANTYPSEYEQEDINDNYYSRILSDRNALNAEFIDDFRSLNRDEKAVFGENMVLTGYPSMEGGQGAFASLQSCFAISSKSKHADAAWEFIKPFFMEEYQTSDDLYNLPSTVAGLDYRVDRAMKKPTYYDEELGKDVEYDETYWVGEEEKLLTPLTKERAEYFKSYVTSVTNTWQSDDEILNIITEEAAPFFAGDKTADEVAKIIQSRVSIYVKENK